MTTKKADEAAEPVVTAPVDVDIQVGDIDEIALKIGSLTIHLPARVEDWPASALQHAADGAIYPALVGAMRPSEVKAFERLRLTTPQVLEVWGAFSRTAGLGSTGE